jgi:hypothetical protein
MEAMSPAERALASLYEAPLDRFVAERGRLAAELRAAGDKSGAADLAKRRRPTISAWVVNQLYRHARAPFDELFAAAARLRNGDLDATGDHRDALAKLRKRAATLLTEGGHGATEATLRRVTTTLSALAANGGFDPDPAGALVADRDPPGFEAMLGATPVATRHGPAAAKREKEDDGAAAAAERRGAEQARREAEAARRAERRALETRLRGARGDLEARERALASVQRELRAAEQAVERARRDVEDIERSLASLDD